jgi:hypothetical protein
MADNWATRDSWKTLPFASTAPLSYHALFTEEEYGTLRRGHVPFDMDDKWFVYWEAHCLFFHRSWTGRGIYRVQFRSSGDRFEVLRASVATDSPWHEQGLDSYEVALLDFLIRALLQRQEVEFPLPPDLKSSFTPEACEHNIAGTGFPRPAGAPGSTTFLAKIRRWIGV